MYAVTNYQKHCGLKQQKCVSQLWRPEVQQVHWAKSKQEVGLSSCQRERELLVAAGIPWLVDTQLQLCLCLYIAFTFSVYNLPCPLFQGFPGCSMVKNLPANAGDEFNRKSPWVGRAPGGRNGNPFQHHLPGESHGRRTLAGYSPWGHKESDSIERLSNFYKNPCVWI